MLVGLCLSTLPLSPGLSLKHIKGTLNPNLAVVNLVMNEDKDCDRYSFCSKWVELNGEAPTPREHLPPPSLSDLYLLRATARRAQSERSGVSLRTRPAAFLCLTQGEHQRHTESETKGLKVWLQTPGSRWVSCLSLIQCVKTAPFDSRRQSALNELVVEDLTLKHRLPTSSVSFPAATQAFRPDISNAHLWILYTFLLLHLAFVLSVLKEFFSKASVNLKTPRFFARSSPSRSSSHGNGPVTLFRTDVQMSGADILTSIALHPLSVCVVAAEMSTKRELCFYARSLGCGRIIVCAAHGCLIMTLGLNAL